MRARKVKTAVATVVLGVVIVSTIFAGYYGFMLSALDPENPNITLADIEKTVSELYPAPEIEAKNLMEKFVRDDIVMFDVRERAEYDQSHIAGAMHLPPNTTQEAFIAEHGSRVNGKIVVFYCAVGVRSSIMHNRMEDGMALLAPTATYNMRGGIFRWFSEGLPVMSNSGPANSVHPYDDAWGKLLARTAQSPRNQLRFSQ
ncbi:MAG: rhodanese-like domain-containing protein [Chitinophagales bacterium]|nr:rhodanese-like domain-containing protein [Hyphomicrobiales bacterium]